MNYSILDLPNFSAALSDESSILKILLKHETEVYKLNIIGSNKFLLKDQIIIVTKYFYATATFSQFMLLVYIALLKYCLMQYY